MKPWMLAVMSGAPELVKLPPFTSSTPWMVPMGVSNLVELVGCGGAGKPATSGTDGYYTPGPKVKIEIYRYKRIDGRPDDVSTFQTPFDWPGDTPPDGSTTIGPIQDGIHYQVEYTIAYGYGNPVYHPGTPGQDATTGASTTAFGKTFPGGYGGPADSITHKNVPVNPGQSYQLVIPPGGSITISYYR